MSDHYLVGTSRHLNYVSDPKQEIQGRSYRNYSQACVRNYMVRIDRSPVFMTHDVDLVWDLLYSIIVNCANVVTPVKTMKV